MIDIVIPYWENEGQELRYALRSFEKYFSGVGNIFIIGDKPSWVNWKANIIHIAAKDGNRMMGRERNIYKKLMLACAHPAVSDTFLFANDDHFMLQHFPAAAFPYYFHTHLEHSLSLAGDNPYRQTIQNTIDLLGKFFQNYDSHCPILLEKQLFMKTFSAVDWTRPYGYCLKTVYCHANGIKGEICLDVKIRRRGEYVALPAGLPYFSADDKAMDKSLRMTLETLYPNKSKYEV